MSRSGPDIIFSPPFENSFFVCFLSVSLMFWIILSPPMFRYLISWFNSSKACCWETSSLDVGWSSKRNFGKLRWSQIWAITRAICTRCCSPPESDWYNLPLRWITFVQCNTSSIILSFSALVVRYGYLPISTTCSTVNGKFTVVCWGKTARCSDSDLPDKPATFLLLRNTWPLKRDTSLDNILNNDVFPAPFGPTTAVNLPGVIVSEQSRRIVFFLIWNEIFSARKLISFFYS